eukprot:TRINITY_DN2406_c0_g1_i1.p1 TRINITY_DN2406_c0_g1~~TRINITY_DN2406_c0_g1_i1.p1  ORF type:complete len:313 (-),score=69.74 TRINITY_DN2406_c0_g1_i1:238-1176(-)
MCAAVGLPKMHRYPSSGFAAASTSAQYPTRFDAADKAGSSFLFGNSGGSSVGEFAPIPTLPRPFLSSEPSAEMASIIVRMESMAREINELRSELSALKPEVALLKPELTQLKRRTVDMESRLRKLEQPNEVLMNLGQAGDLSLDLSSSSSPADLVSSGFEEVKSWSSAAPAASQPKPSTDLQELLSVSTPALTSTPVPMNLDEAPASEVEIRKKVGKIVSAVPHVESTNPNAALINFCKHQLKFDVEFRCTEENDTHYVKIIFPDDSERAVAEASDKKKKRAKEVAAKLTLQKLNSDTAFLQKWIDWALARP